MDNERFDQFTQVLGTPAGRRGVLGMVAGLVAGGSLLAIGQQGARARSTKHGRKGCKAHALGKTCAGKCGIVTNNCHKHVDCGPCAPTCLPNGAVFPPGHSELCCEGQAGTTCSKNCVTDSDCLANQTCFDFGPTKLCLMK